MILYIASTAEYSGKTLVALALGSLWAARGLKVGYVKPIGKIPVTDGSTVFDEDAAFLAKELGLAGPPESVCPVVVTQDLVMACYRGEATEPAERIDRAVRDAEARCEVLLLGGTANLRDGLFLGLSPLGLIERFGCRVLLVDRFEGEKSMDQVLWAAGALGPRLLGVLFNRVAPAQEAFVRETVRPFLARAGIRVAGSVPADPLLDSVSVEALAAHLGATVACAADRLGTMVERFCVGAMDVDSALRIFRRHPRKAVVTGGSRTDIQLAALETDTRCLVLTGGIAPGDLIAHRAADRGIPVLVVRDDTMATVERLEKLLGRLRIREKEKARRGVELIATHADVDGILAALRGGTGR